jgi:arsenate reductase
MIKIYHNPRCGKSRECLAFIENSKQEFEIIKYLEDPLDYSSLEKLIQKLNIHPIELVRTKEAIWIEQYKNTAMSDKAILQAIVDHPILMERPVVEYGNKAVIARPWEKINNIL